MRGFNKICLTTLYLILSLYIFSSFASLALATDNIESCLERLFSEDEKERSAAWKELEADKDAAKKKVQSILGDEKKKDLHLAAKKALLLLDGVATIKEIEALEELESIKNMVVLRNLSEPERQYVIDFIDGRIIPQTIKPIHGMFYSGVLQWVNDKRSYDVLLKMLRLYCASSPMRAENILEDIVRARGRRSEKDLVALLADANLSDEVRIKVGGALAGVGSKRGLELLDSYARSRDSDVRIKAIQEMGRSGNLQAVDALLKRCVTEQDEKCLAEIVNSLSLLGYKDEKFYRKMLSEESFSIRVASAASLAKSGIRKGQEEMASLAAWAKEGKAFGKSIDARLLHREMVKHGGEPAVKFFEQDISDPNPFVVLWALRRLSEMNEPRAISIFEEGLSISPDSIDLVMAENLARNGSTLGRSIVLESYESGLQRYSWLSSVIVDLPYREFEGHLCEIAERKNAIPSYWKQAAALKTLGRLRSERSRKTLRKMVKSQYHFHQLHAAISLARQGDLSAVEMILDSLKDTRMTENELAGEALKFLFDQDLKYDMHAPQEDIEKQVAVIFSWVKENRHYLFYHEEEPHWRLHKGAKASGIEAVLWERIPWPSDLAETERLSGKALNKIEQRRLRWWQARTKKERKKLLEEGKKKLEEYRKLDAEALWVGVPFSKWRLIPQESREKWPAFSFDKQEQLIAEAEKKLLEKAGE